MFLIITLKPGSPGHRLNQRMAKYQLYNEKLGYLDPTVYEDAKEAVLASSNKCKMHSVREINDDGTYRTLSIEEEIELFKK